MNEIDRRLVELDKQNKAIHLSLIGAGQMGKDIVAQVSSMIGITMY